jgi:hypothetical protein
LDICIEKHIKTSQGKRMSNICVCITHPIKTLRLLAGGVAQMVEHLSSKPSKCKTLRSSPSIIKKDFYCYIFILFARKLSIKCLTFWYKFCQITAVSIFSQIILKQYSR